MLVGRGGLVVWLSLARGLAVSCGCDDCELPELGHGSDEARGGHNHPGAGELVFGEHWVGGGAGLCAGGDWKRRGVDYG